MGKDLIGVMMNMVLWANKHLGERLDIPKDKKALLESDPDRFAQMTLDNLDQWEREFLPA